MKGRIFLHTIVFKYNNTNIHQNLFQSPYTIYANMIIIPSKPTLWVQKDNFVTKILKDQWAKWGASSVCFLIKKIPPKDFTISLVNDKKKKIDTDDFQISFEKEETNELGHKNMKLYTYNGTETIPNVESELFLKVQINFCSSKYAHTVMHVQVLCNEHKAFTPPFYVASRARGVGDKPVIMCISLDEIKTLRKPKAVSKKKTLWGKKRKRNQISSSEEDTDTDSDTDTERETYVNTKQILKETTALRKEVSDMKKTIEELKQVIDQLLTQRQEGTVEEEVEGEEDDDEDEEEENDKNDSPNTSLFGSPLFDDFTDSDAQHVYDSFKSNSSWTMDPSSIFSNN